MDEMVGRKSRAKALELMHFILVAMSIAFTSCDATIHFYPEPTDKNKSQIRLNVDWSGYGKTIPTGMTVLCHHTETGEKVSIIDNNTDYVTPYLKQGRHWATVFNLTEDEFNYVAFRGLDAVETSEAYALERVGSKWYSGRSDGNNYLAECPEWLAVDTIMTDHVAESPADGLNVIGTLYPQNIIYTLHIAIYTENISNLRSARGAISGLASGRRFVSGEPNINTTTVTHLIESSDWSRSRISSYPDIGVVKADITCFGLPGNHNGSADENYLEFQAMLSDGKTVWKYEIPVGNLIVERYSPTGRRGDNLNLYLDVWLNPPLPPGGDSDWGFDVWIDDWDEQDDFHIPF